MAQIVITGHRAALDGRRQQLSDAIHAAVMGALDYPAEKRFHRFIALDHADFVHPADRGDDYTIIEIAMFEGRTESAKRRLIEQLFERIEAVAGIVPRSVEITITETPRSHWGIRGVNGADLALGYTVEV